jgi:methylglutaconyl-CoA hydratase
MEFVQSHVKDRIGYIILNRPEKRNALNSQFVTELKSAFTSLEEDNNCKVIVLRANGEAFCAGADLGYLKELQKNTFEENLQDSRHLMEFFKQIYLSPKVVIAQIEGHAIAGGCGLATVCDFSYSVAEAKFGYTEVKIGFIPAIVKVILLRKIGEGKSKELLLTGKLIDAQKASEMGLINEVIPNSEIASHVEGFALNLCNSASSESLKRTKQMIAEVQSMDLNDAFDYAAEQNAHSRESDDCKKGIASFINKEKIVW